MAYRLEIEEAQAATEMTFFSRFVADILAGKKVITIRDESENN